MWINKIVLFLTFLLASLEGMSQDSIRQSTIVCDTLGENCVKLIESRVGVIYSYRNYGNSYLERIGTEQITVTRYYLNNSGIPVTKLISSYRLYAGIFLIHGNSYHVSIDEQDTLGVFLYKKGLLVLSKEIVDGSIRKIVEYSGLNNKNGDYTEFNTNGVVSVKGQYAQNRKIGLWEYFGNNGALDSCGKYSGKYELIMVPFEMESGFSGLKEIPLWLRKGNWKYYRNGELVLTKKYDDNGKLVKTTKL